MQQISLAIVLSVAFSVRTLSAAEDWPEFRGPSAQGIATVTELPTNWDKDSPIWKQSLPGNGWSSPVVQDGQVFVTAAVPIGEEEVSSESKYKRQTTTPYSLRTLCLDYASGDILWTVETSTVPAETSIHPKNSHASPTPIVTRNRLFVHFGTFGTAALDLNGEILWNRRIEYDPVHGSGGSPILFEDTLILNCDGSKDPFVTAIDVETGKERWRTPRPTVKGPKFSFSTPLLIDVNGTPQVVSAGSHVACAYDPRTGREIWSVRYPNRWSVVPRPVYANGLILLCTGYEGPAEMLTIRADGKGDVTESHIAWRVNRFVPHNPSPIIHREAVYTVDDDGIAACRDLMTGEIQWKKRLGGNFSASPIMGEGRIYFMSEDGTCTIIKAAREFEQIARNKLDERTFASIAALDGSLIIRTESNIYRFGRNP